MTHHSAFAFVPDQRVVSGMTREQVCLRMRARVLHMARDVCGRKGHIGSLTVDDIASCGMEGLLKAFDRYEPSFGTSFDSYARIRVRGAMVDAMRAQDTMSRYGRRNARHAENAAREVHRERGHEAQASDVAHRLGMDLDGYWKVSRETASATVLSLDAPIGDVTDGDSPLLADTIADDSVMRPDRKLQQTEAVVLLRAAIETLPDRHRECVVLHYDHGVAQTDIAQRFGVTVSRVSQILAAAREKLRQALVASVDAEDLV